MLLLALVGDRRELATCSRLDLPMLVDLLADGHVKLRVTNAGLSEIATDGLVRVRGKDHLIECDVVQLAARGARRKGECTCGSVPS
jgi:hypothetical protein